MCGFLEPDLKSILAFLESPEPRCRLGQGCNRKAFSSRLSQDYSSLGRNLQWTRGKNASDPKGANLRFVENLQGLGMLGVGS